MQQIVSKLVAITDMNLNTPKVAVKLDHLLNKPVSNANAKTTTNFSMSNIFNI
jgi:hypothetical protein